MNVQVLSDQVLLNNYLSGDRNATFILFSPNNSYKE